MHLRFNKLNFIFLAVALILSPLALKAQSTAPKWTGFHAGVIGGAVAGTYNLHLDSGGSIADLDSTLAGARVGVRGGVDVNFKGFLVGAVADWSWSNAKFKFDETGGGFDEELHSTVKQITTIRARVGRSHGHVLSYVHGGLLLADTEFKDTVSGTTIVPESGIHPGFVVGAGAEYFVAPHYTVSTEYGYNHVSGVTISDTSGFLGALGTEHMHFSTLTVGFNYHF